MAIKIGIVSEKGGSTKSTVTYELAYLLTKRGFRTLVISYDQQADLDTYMGLKEYKREHNPKTIYDVLTCECQIKEAIHTLTNFGFDVIMSDKRLSNSDKIFCEADDLFLLQDTLSIIDNDYDIILIDNNPSRNTQLTMVFIATDYVIIPTEISDGSLDAIYDVYNDIEKLRKRKFSNTEILGVVLNKYERSIVHRSSKIQLKKICDSIDIPYFNTTIRKSVEVDKSKKFYEPVNYYNPNLPVSLDFRNFANELVKMLDLDKILGVSVNE